MNTNKALLPATKLQLCRKWPYAATAVMSVKPIPKPGIGTAAIDKNFRLYYDPEFIESLHKDKGIETVIGLLAHEVAHPMLRHHKRAERIKDPSDDQWQKRWNIAADLSINSMLRAEGLTLPEEGMFPEKFGFDEELSAEAYYSLLLDQEQEQEQEQGEGSGGGDGGQGDSDSDGEGSSGGDGDPGDDEPQDHPGGSGADGVERSWEDPPPTETEPDNGLTDSEVETIARMCAQAAKSIGTKSAGMDREAGEVLEPKIDPRRLLMRAIAKQLTEASSGAGVSSYRRPSRRPAIGGVLRPRTVCPVPKVSVIVDTSGSMGGRDLAQCLGLIAKTLRVIGTSGVDVVAGDTKACAESKAFHPRQVTSLNLAGGGGTDMAAIIEDVASRRQAPDLIICATDGGTGWPEEKLKVPVVACITEQNMLWNEPPPWMEVVHMK